MNYQTTTIALDHERFVIGYEEGAGGIYRIWSEADYFRRVFEQPEIRVRLGDYKDERRAGDYGPTVFPATEADFVLQAIARAILCEPPVYE